MMTEDTIAVSIIKETLEKKEHTVEINFNGINLAFIPLPKEEKQIDISGIAVAREKIGNALLSLNCSNDKSEVRDYLLKAVGCIDEFIKEYGAEVR